jgi:hypothetical protein
MMRGFQNNCLELEVYDMRAKFAAQEESFKEELAKLCTVIRDQGLRFNTKMGEAREHLGGHRWDIEQVRRTARMAQEEVEDLEAEVVILRAQADSMEGRLCRCGKQSPVWMGDGSAEAPLVLEGEGSP